MKTPCIVGLIAGALLCSCGPKPKDPPANTPKAVADAAPLPKKIPEVPAPHPDLVKPPRDPVVPAPSQQGVVAPPTDVEPKSKIITPPISPEPGKGVIPAPPNVEPKPAPIPPPPPEVKKT